jgi:ATP synthase protein I
MSRREAYRLFAHYSGIIFMLPACLLVGFLIGDYLDDWLDTAPVLTLVFILLGAAAGFIQVFRLLKIKL